MAQNKFYDRTEELRTLTEKYRELEESEKSVMLAIYGRRRVGKTELVRTWMENKPRKLYLYVDLAEKKVLLTSFSSAVQEQLKENVIFPDFESFFKYITEKSEEHSFILIIDEFQRFLSVAPEVITSLQKHWDISLKNKKIMILLVGSSIGMIQKITSSKAGALYGRASKIKISSFRYQDFRLMFKDFNEEEKIQRYAVFGGTPYYIEKTKRFNDTITAIQELLLKKGGELSEEPKTLLEYENVRIHSKYNSILQSISSGKDILKEIQDFTKIPSTTIPAYLDKLDYLLDLVEKNDPLLGKERLRRYRIKDNFFKFWYKFIFKNQTALNLNNINFVLEIIKTDLNSYVGKIFEDIIKELLISYNGKEINNHLINFENIGSWWDRNNNEVDILTNNSKNKAILVGEIKWSSKPVDFDVVDNLLRKSKFINAGGKYDFLIVSKAGFTAVCETKMKENNFLYLDLKGVAELFNKISQE